MDNKQSVQDGPWSQFQTQKSQSTSEGPWSQFADQQENSVVTTSPDEYMQIPNGWLLKSNPNATPSAPLNLGDGVSIPFEFQEDFFKKQAEQRKATKESKRQWIDKRGALERTGDTSSFLLSLIPRILTGGKYGAGDAIAATGLQSAGQSLQKSEQDFALANESGLKFIGNWGEASLGVPMLSGMGHVSKGFGRGLSHMANKRQAELGAHLFDKSKESIKRLEDIKAFENLGAQPFGPSLGSTGSARIARTIEEFPVIGNVIKKPKEAIGEAVEQAQQSIAGKLGSQLSDEGTGLVAQRGLRRYRTANLEDLEPGLVKGLGINPSVAVNTGKKASNDVVNISKPSKFDTSQLTPKELDLVASSKVRLPQSTRRTVDDLSDVELDKVVKAPANKTSFAVRSNALYEKAHRSLPPLTRKDGSRNPNLVKTENAKVVARGMLKEEKSASIKGGVLEGRFGGLVEKLTNAKANMTIDSMRSARTQIGRALAEFGEFDTRLSRTQLKQLYGAITKDLQASYLGVAARARKNSKLDPSNPAYVTKEVADKANRTLYEFNKADRYFRQGMANMERFMNVLGSKSMEEATRKLGRYMRENTQDIATVRTVKNTLRPEEWNAVVGHVVGNLGRGRAGAKNAGSGFNWEAWATDWHRLSDASKNMMFKDLSPSLRQEIDSLARVVDRMKYYESTKNYSGSAYTGAGIATLAGVFDPTAWAGLLTTAGGSAAMGKFLTTEAYVKWLNYAAKISENPSNAMKMRIHLDVLKKMAAKEPDPALSKVADHIVKTIGVSKESNNQALIGR